MTTNSSVELCRFCAEAKSKLLNLTENEEDYKKCLIILEFFNVAYVDLSVEDNLPKSICDPCYTSLTNAYEFFNKVLQSQEDLKQFYHEQEEKIENTETVQTFILPEINSISESETGNDKKSNETKNIKNKSSQIYKIRRNYKTRAKKQIRSDSESDNELVYAGLTVFTENITPNPDKNKNDLDTQSDGILTSDNESDFIEFTYAGYSMFNDREKAWAYYTWRCTYCQGRFDTLMLLRTHSIEAHNSCAAFTCDDCHEDFKVYDEFIEHIRYHHENLRYYCKYCDHYSETIDECIQHEKSHNDYFHACISCGELFENAISLARHKKKVEAGKNVDKSNEDSNDSLSSFDEAINEVGSKIPPSDIQIETWRDYPWICPICQLAFFSIDQWRMHGKMKHGRCAAYKCFDCKRYRCQKLRHLIGHIGSHRPNLSLQCHFCYEVKINEDALRKHIVGHLQNYFWCNYCGEKFTEEEALQTHLKKYRTIQHKRKAPFTAEELTCKICGKISKTNRSLSVHLRIHGDHNFACEICGQTFNSKSNLSIHLLRHDKQFSCDLCMKAFPSRSHIIKHLETHYDKKQFTCEECGYKCRTMSALKQHQIKHSTLLPFVCKICNKGFKTALYLRRHGVQHTGEKPYLCKFCYKAFSNAANCHKHMKRIHPADRIVT